MYHIYNGSNSNQTVFLEAIKKAVGLIPIGISVLECNLTLYLLKIIDKPTRLCIIPNRKPATNDVLS